MKTFVLVLCVAALIYPAAAGAKGAVGLEVCGSDGCQSQHGNVLGPGGDGNGPFTGLGGVIQPAAPSGWYRVSLLIGEPNGKVFGRIPLFYVPSAHMLVQPGQGQGREEPAWWYPQPRLRRAVEALASRLTPFQPPADLRVMVNGHSVADPHSYLRLYTIGSKTDRYPTEDDAAYLTFTSSRQSPWTTGNYMVLYPKAGLLVRDGQIVAVSRTIVDRVMRGASLSPGRGFPWLVAALVAAAAFVACALAAAYRRRPRTAPHPLPQA
jgi:hypothetical protein